MKVKKAKITKITHPLDTTKSKKFQRAKPLPITATDYRTDHTTDHHVNAHAFFSPRTSLNQGRGK